MLIRIILFICLSNACNQPFDHAPLRWLRLPKAARFLLFAAYAAFPCICVLPSCVIRSVQDHVVAHAAAAALSLSWIASSKRLEESARRRPVTAAAAVMADGAFADGHAADSKSSSLNAVDMGAGVLRPKTSFVVIKPGSAAQVMRTLHRIPLAAFVLGSLVISNQHLTHACFRRRCLIQQARGRRLTPCSCMHPCGRVRSLLF
jgi:hypothetical protein